jgi:hypothetical protein
LDSQLETLHNKYKQCVADQVVDHFNKGTIPNEELCTNEKAEFYTYLHENKKVEHDNLMRYYSKVILKND